MYPKLVVLSIFGLFVQDGQGEFESVKMSEIAQLNLSRYVLTTGDNPVKQIICTSNEGLCNKYGLETALVKNTRHPTAVSWFVENVKNYSHEFIEIDELTVKCEKVPSTTDMDDFIVIKDSCRLSYVLRLKTERKSAIGNLTLSKSQLTLGLHPTNQLRCIGGEICDKVDVPVVKCFLNNKIDLGGWSCHADNLKSFVKFRQVSVVCEDVNGTFGDEVIRGSCRVDYDLQVNTQKLNTGQNIRLAKNRDTVGFHIEKQLNCVDDDEKLCSKYALSTTTCTNKELVVWKCSGPVRTDVYFKNKNMTCEIAPGFTDGTIVAGSCRLRYSLTKNNPKTLRDACIRYLWLYGFIPGIILLAVVIIIGITCTCRSSSVQSCDCQTRKSAVTAYRNPIYDTQEQTNRYHQYDDFRQ